MCTMAALRLGTTATDSTSARCSVSNASAGAGCTWLVMFEGGGERCASARKEGGSQSRVTEASRRAPAMRGQIVVRMDL